MYTIKKENISLWQLFVLILIFVIGTTVVVGAGEEAKQDFWFAELIATAIGMAFAWGYYYFLRTSNGKNLYEVIEETCGRIIGKVLIFGYVIYFFYIVTRNIRDFGEMMKVTILPITPIEVISITMMFVVVFIVIQGVEVLARVTELFTPFLVFFLLLVFFLIFASEQIHFENLQPFLAEGFKPIFSSVFPLRSSFPYGEMVVFTVLMTSVTRFNYVGKVSVVSIMVGGLLITFSQVIQIATLGEDVKNRTLFPLLSASREISVMGFFERVDILVVFILMLGILIKVSILFYGGLKGLESIFNMSYRYFIIPISMCIPLFSIVNADNIVEHFEEGLLVVPYVLHLPFQMGIPILLLVLVLIRNRKNKKVAGGVKY
ncbi:GerAB/ArcD/ProY family transporter [Halalkalibacter lacteus]|uniref:GerAB/ArcD/ProY family transporter n=1 Tax=Halalkalibacter lacteus TaxID=3090663 RepID=UPI002FCAC173